MMMQVYYNDIDNFCCDVLEKNIGEGHLYSGIVDRRNITDVSGEELKQYGQVHLFAGIGAFPLGFRWARMPASISIVTAGVPCQPHSVAGKRLGKKDDRNLWPETIRVIAELQPTWFIFENVLGIRTTILDEVLSDLDGLAYSTRTLIIPACAFNAPHRRERIFVIAHSKSNIRRASRNDRPIPSNGSSSLVADSEGRYTRKSPEQKGWKNTSRRSQEIDNVADAESRGIKRIFSERENPRGLGSGSWWATEQRVRRVVDGISKGIHRHWDAEWEGVPRIILGQLNRKTDLEHSEMP